MPNPKDKLIERRRYLRLRSPIKITYTVPGSTSLHSATTKDISADGLRFETTDKNLNESCVMELKMEIPVAVNPVHAKAAIMWKRRLSLEDASPSDVGALFTEIEEDNKNTFLKFLCDEIYNLPKESKHAARQG